MQPTSRITSKGRTTIPRAVRQKLSLRPGDVLVYELDEDEVRVRKQAPLMSPIFGPCGPCFASGTRPRTRPPSTIFEQFGPSSVAPFEAPVRAAGMSASGRPP